MRTMTILKRLREATRVDITLIEKDLILPQHQPPKYEFNHKNTGLVSDQLFARLWLLVLQRRSKTIIPLHSPLDHFDHVQKSSRSVREGNISCFNLQQQLLIEENREDISEDEKPKHPIIPATFWTALEPFIGQITPEHLALIKPKVCYKRTSEFESVANLWRID